MNFLSEKKYGVPSHNFVKKNVLCEKGDEITRFDGTVQYSTHIQTADDRNVLEHAKKTKLLFLTSTLSPTPRSTCHTEKRKTKRAERYGACSSLLVLFYKTTMVESLPCF